jgi:hypothetical protein
VITYTNNSTILMTEFGGRYHGGTERCEKEECGKEEDGRGRDVPRTPRHGRRLEEALRARPVRRLLLYEEVGGLSERHVEQDWRAGGVNVVSAWLYVRRHAVKSDLTLMEAARPSTYMCVLA